MIKAERRSKQREYILKYMKQSKIHPTAEEVYLNVKADVPNISLGTVYRNLVLLSECKKIMKIMNVNGVHHYDGNTDNHYHLLCSKCGKIYDLDIETLPLEDAVNKRTNHTALSHMVNFAGICEECSKK